jgi:hypothetical protein
LRAGRLQAQCRSHVPSPCRILPELLRKGVSIQV